VSNCPWQRDQLESLVGVVGCLSKFNIPFMPDKDEELAMGKLEGNFSFARKLIADTIRTDVSQVKPAEAELLQRWNELGAQGTIGTFEIFDSTNPIVADFIFEELGLPTESKESPPKNHFWIQF
jgi:hypothetical protein